MWRPFCTSTAAARVAANCFRYCFGAQERNVAGTGIDKRRHAGYPHVAGPSIEGRGAAHHCRDVTQRNRSGTRFHRSRSVGVQIQWLVL